MTRYQVDEVLTIGEMARYIAQGARDYTQAHVQQFETKEALLAYLLPYIDKACMILVKGSRGMKLDEVVDELAKHK